MHLASLHPIIAVGTFSKWGINFMTCHPALTSGHKYIIVVVNCFNKWVEAMPTFSNSDKTNALFMFNHIIERFGVLE